MNLLRDICEPQQLNNGHSRAKGAGMFFCSITLLLSWNLHSEENVSWALNDPELNHDEGTSTQRAYAELHLKEPSKPILVAVIDSGVDINQPDLKDVIWTNDHMVPPSANVPGAAADNATPTKPKAIMGDLHGWNFIGSYDGHQLTTGRMEVTRELSRLKHLQAKGAATPEIEKRIAEITAEYDNELQMQSQAITRDLERTGLADEMFRLLTKEGLKENSQSALKAFDSKTPSCQLFKGILLQLNPQGRSLEAMQGYLNDEVKEMDTQYGLDFEESSVIGDNPEQLDEQGYGNPDVFVKETSAHGTLVAGVIGAIRNNHIGAMGQCAWVRIIVVRAVPDGDERDKDVANAVRYAVDHGAQIINMSFGKGISPHKEYVDAAFRYAADKNVLVVHASGNDGENTDASPRFPNRHPLHAAAGVTSEDFPNWIEVGASSDKKGPHLPAVFSNYGATSVDIFAPGTRITSTAQGGGVDTADGTSLASPEVAGVAALVLSQHPELTAVQLKKALMDHARKYPNLMVVKPGTNREMVPFSSLSVSGGIVDAYATLKALDPTLSHEPEHAPGNPAPASSAPEVPVDVPPQKSTPATVP
jgi:cell wall-associated protease